MWWKKNGIVSGITFGNSPNDGEKQQQRFVNLSVQQTNTRDNSKLQTMTLVVIDVGRRTISLLFKFALANAADHKQGYIHPSM